MDASDRWKRAAALRAVELVESGMLVGLGTGSTARHFIADLGARLSAGELGDVRAVPSSEESERQALALGIPIVDLPAEGLDLAVDGMDEVTDELDAIKGLGGALTREKIVASAARRFVLIGDDRKRVARLGERAPLPVEVVRFGVNRTRALLRELGAEPELRGGAQTPAVTDNGNLIVDLRFGGPFDAAAVAEALAAVPGVVEHGLFLGMAERAFIAGEAGVTELVAPSS